MSLPSFEVMHSFLARQRKYEGFEGRNNNTWGTDYSACVTRSTLQSLADHGIDGVSRHESITGKAIWFDASLRIITDDAEIKAKLSNSVGASRAISVSGGSPRESVTV